MEALSTGAWYIAEIFRYLLLSSGVLVLGGLLWELGRVSAKSLLTPRVGGTP